MSNYTYASIVAKAKNIKENVEKEYELGEASTWSYYIAKEVIQRTKTVTKITVHGASKSTGNDFGRQISKSYYLDMAKRFTAYVEKNHQLPNNIKVNGKWMRVSDYTYMFSRILVYYDTNKKLPSKANINSKAFIKPSESTDTVYDYFVKVFGKVSCIDDALEKIAGRGYGYYYDDVYSNRQSIDRVKAKLGINCTDATQMMKHVADGTGKYKKVEGYHVRCRGGDGHIFLKITNKDGSVFYRDPAAVLDNGNVESVWCMNGTHLATNPSWWTANLNR